MAKFVPKRCKKERETEESKNSFSLKRVIQAKLLLSRDCNLMRGNWNGIAFIDSRLNVLQRFNFFYKNKTLQYGDLYYIDEKIQLLPDPIKRFSLFRLLLCEEAATTPRSTLLTTGFTPPLLHISRDQVDLTDVAK